jgi:hypothetical protein
MKKMKYRVKALKKGDMKRYAEMPPLLRHEKIVKTNEGRRQNSYLTGIYNVVLPVCL